MSPLGAPSAAAAMVTSGGYGTIYAVPASQPLPNELVAALHRARDVEAAADTLFRHRRATAASGALMLAAMNEGWTITSMAEVLGVTRAAAAGRVQSARRRLGPSPAGIDVPPTPATLRAEIEQARDETPLEQRAWLITAEALAVTGISMSTLRNWRRAGLLPNTQRDGRRYLYLRADLLRVQRGERYNSHGANYAALRERISRSPA